MVTWGSAPDGGDSSAVAGQLTGVTDVYSTYSAFAAVKDDGSVVTWGAGYGGDSSAVAGQLAGGVTKISSTLFAFAALKDDGSVVTWGDPTTGRPDYNYGQDSSAVAEQLTGGVTKIYSTHNAFAALKDDGSVVTWGQPDGGGDITWGFDDWDGSAVAEQLAGGVIDVYSAEGAFAALKDDGSVVTWGFYGGDSSAVAEQLASGVTKIYGNDLAFAALKDDGSVVTWGVASDGGDSSAVAGQLTGVTDIYSTSTAFAALKDDGSVVTWGSHGGYSGDVAEQLAGGVTDIYSTQSAFAALKSDGSVVTWGFSGGDSSAVAEQLASGVAFLASPFHSTPSSGGDTGGGGGTGGGDTGGGGTGGGGDGRSILFNSASDSGFFGDLSRGLGLAGIANTIGEVFNLGHSPALGFVNNVRGVIAGVQDIVTGVATRDFGTLLNGILDTSTGVVGLVVKTPVGLALTLSASLAKLYASFWVPIGNTEQMDFLNFIGQCKFHKGTDELNGSEATQISNRYSGFLGLGNLMSDYSNYKLRGVHQFFGQTGCP